MASTGRCAQRQPVACRRTSGVRSQEMGGLDACSGCALAKRAGAPQGWAWAGATGAATCSAVGETAEWQITQAAQGAPWLWSPQPGADALAAQCSASVGAAACALALKASCGAGLWWCGVCRSVSAAAAVVTAGECDVWAAGASPWWPAWAACVSSAAAVAAMTASGAPMAGSTPMAMASPARPRRASSTTRKKESMRRMQGMIPPGARSSVLAAIRCAAQACRRVPQHHGPL